MEPQYTGSVFNQRGQQGQKFDPAPITPTRPQIVYDLTEDEVFNQSGQQGQNSDPTPSMSHVIFNLTKKESYSSSYAAAQYEYSVTNQRAHHGQTFGPTPRILTQSQTFYNRRTENEGNSRSVIEAQYEYSVFNRRKYGAQSVDPRHVTPFVHHNNSFSQSVSEHQNRSNTTSTVPGHVSTGLIRRLMQRIETLEKEVKTLNFIVKMNAECANNVAVNLQNEVKKLCLIAQRNREKPKRRGLKMKLEANITAESHPNQRKQKYEDRWNSNIGTMGENSKDDLQTTRKKLNFVIKKASIIKRKYLLGKKKYSQK